MLHNCTAESNNFLKKSEIQHVNVIISQVLSVPESHTSEAF